MLKCMLVNRDLTVGKPAKVLLSYCLPLFISTVFQQFYSITDGIIVGKFGNESALASVGVAQRVVSIFLGIAIGFNAGCAVIISQLFGAKKYGKLRTAYRTMLFTFGAVALILVVCGLIFCRALLRAINTPAEIFEGSATYMNVYFYGLAFVFLYNLCMGVFNALGDSKTPLFLLIFSSVLNVILDVVFVAVFKWGVAGVAWATFIAQASAAIISAVIMFRRIRRLPKDGDSGLFSPHFFGKIFLFSSPCIMQQLAVTVGNVLVLSAINSFGDERIVAGFTSSFSLSIVALAAFITFSNGLSVFSAQNLGARKPERIKYGLISAVLIAYSIALPMMLLFEFFGDKCLLLFLNDVNGVSVETGWTYLKIVSPFYFFVILKICCDGVIKGSGQMLLFSISTLVDLFLRVVLAFILTPVMGINGVGWAWAIGWIVGMGVSVLFYSLGKWKKNFTLAD